MIIKKYGFRRDFFSYFGNNHTDYYEFDTLSEALNAYRESCSHDFDYDDAWSSTHSLVFLGFKYVPDPVIRPHARSGFDWARMAHDNEHKHTLLNEDEIDEIIAEFMSFLENCEDNNEVLI